MKKKSCLLKTVPASVQSRAEKVAALAAEDTMDPLLSMHNIAGAIIRTGCTAPAEVANVCYHEICT